MFEYEKKRLRQESEVSHRSSWMGGGTPFAAVLRKGFLTGDGPPSMDGLTSMDEFQLKLWVIGRMSFGFYHMSGFCY